jgi:amino acid transporter
MPENDHKAVKFGTFGGVFTPSILTIFGVIMFMRANFVIGQAGIYAAITILLIAKAITLLTTLSVSAISTNMQVRGGGAYFMISRVLGPEFGGAIGLALFFAQALSVPFYLLGFSEAVVRAMPGQEEAFVLVALISAAVLFVISFIGASWAIKTQYLIMTILFLAILAFMIGAFQQFSFETLQTNLSSGYTSIPGQESKYSYWMIFAIFFPAVTGILAGINMSGDLEKPSESIPRGTFWAVGVGFIVYLMQIVICGGAFERSALIDYPYETLVSNAFMGTSFMVAAGVYAATLSSALGSYLGAPRILQAVARDGIIEGLKFFAKGTAKNDEPRRAIVLTGIITVMVIMWAANQEGGGSLNIVASIITMFFLFTYGMVNVAAFIEAYTLNPSFRPKFKYFHWSFSLLGAIGCVGAAFLIDPKNALIAILLLIGLFHYIRNKELKMSFGDARRGFVFTAMRNNLIKLAAMEEDSRNWRPTILVFSGNPATRATLANYAVWLESGRGVVFMTNILIGLPEKLQKQRKFSEKQLQKFCRENNITAFPISVVAENIAEGVNICLQGLSVGPVKPNLVMFGWPGGIEAAKALLSYLRLAQVSGIGQLLVCDKGLPDSEKRKRRIDIWWRGRQNGSLMIMLALLLKNNWDWAAAEVRVIRAVENQAGIEPAREALQNLLDEVRVEGSALVIITQKSFKETMIETSADSDLVFLGFESPQLGDEDHWFNGFAALLEVLPTTIMVKCARDSDLLENKD